MQAETAAAERVFREEYCRLIASLVRRFSDDDLAEEVAGEATVAALKKWPDSGVPPNPGGWLTTTAVHHAIERITGRLVRSANQVLFGRSDQCGRRPVRHPRIRKIVSLAQVKGRSRHA